MKTELFRTLITIVVYIIIIATFMFILNNLLTINSKLDATYELLLQFKTSGVVGEFVK